MSAVGDTKIVDGITVVAEVEDPEAFEMCAGCDIILGSTACMAMGDCCEMANGVTTRNLVWKVRV